MQARVQPLQRRARRRAGRTGREDANLALAEGGAVVDFVAARALAHGLSAAVDTVLLQEGHRQSVRSRRPGPEGADRVPIPTTSVPSQISSFFAYMGLPLLQEVQTGPCYSVNPFCIPGEFISKQVQKA